MIFTCPNCQARLQATSVQQSNQRKKCPRCNSLVALSLVAETSDSDPPLAVELPPVSTAGVIPTEQSETEATQPPTDVNEQVPSAGSGWRSRLSRRKALLASGVALAVILLAVTVTHRIFFNPIDDFVGEWVAGDESSEWRLVFTENGDVLFCMQKAPFLLYAHTIEYTKDYATHEFTEANGELTRYTAELKGADQLELKFLEDVEPVTFKRVSTLPHFDYSVFYLPDELEEIHSESSEFISLQPRFGYAWLEDEHITLQTEWSPGTVDSETHRVAGDVEGEWSFLAGYAATNFDEDFGIWVPGANHPDHPGVVADRVEGKWRRVTSSARTRSETSEDRLIRQLNELGEQMAQIEEDWKKVEPFWNAVFGGGTRSSAGGAYEESTTCYNCDGTGINPEWVTANRAGPTAFIVDKECPDCNGRGWTR